ncbi:MAG TPA: membrane protein insertase YidC [Treponema sp.]|nr:membrane protein insertase YidC [Treponema sp.]
MDKNTVWALILSLLVMVGAFFVNIKFIKPRQDAARQQQQIELAQKEAEQKKKVEEANKQVSTLPSENQEETITPASETDLTITTDKVKVLFSQKGGDIVSYQLLEHFDKDTGKGVQMADNISEFNRAFALSFGDSSGVMLNEMFNVKKEGPNDIGFYRTYNIKDSSGVSHKYLIGKHYSFKENEYIFKFDVTVKPLDGTRELDVNGAAYTIRTSPQIGPHFDRKKNRNEVREILEFYNNKRFRKDIQGKTYDRPFEWAGVGGKYFAILIKPQNVENISSVVKTSAAVENGYGNSQIFLTRLPLKNGISTDEFYVYIGPRSENELIKYNLADKNKWGILNAKFNQALKTTGVFSLIEMLLKWALEKIHIFIHNWGLAIIALTVILKIILFPLSKKSAMGTLKMQEIQPKMQAIQAKYRDNPQKLNEETAKLYKESGYNPVSGCLPMILQMFILFALYNVFNNYFEFRGASFIKGWIDDLSEGEYIWSWKREIPLLSSFSQNKLRLLPIIYTLSQLVTGKITQYGGAGTAQSQSQMKFMMYGMPILFFFILYNVPSGLLIYWIVSNVLQMVQQLLINSYMKKKRLELVTDKPVLDKNTLKFKGGKKKTR